MRKDDDELVAYPSRPAIVLLFVGSIALFVLGLWAAGLLGTQPEGRFGPAASQVVGWACIVLFGACGFIAIKMFFDRRDQVYIGQIGIRWRRWSDQTIPWSEIADVTVWEYQWQKFIVLHLHDATRFPGKGLQALLARPNRALTRGDISITMMATDRSFAEAMEAIERFRR